MTRGSLWSSGEVKCLLEIWADEDIQSQLDNTNKNSEIYGIIRDYMHARGYNRTIEQCRAKVKKMRYHYNAVRKSSSSTDEKDKFPWYDAVDSIIGRKPTSEPNVVKSQPITPPPVTPSTSSDQANMAPFSPPISLPRGIKDETHTETSDSSPRAADNDGPRPADNRRKRKAKTGKYNMMGAFMDMQKKQYDDFMQAEQLRQQQEKDSLDAWMKTQTELDERWLQAQREERQESKRMFMQMMSRLFDIMVPSSQQETACDDVL